MWISTGEVAKGGHAPVKITKKELPAFVRDQASQLQSATAFHLLEGTISGLVLPVSNK